MYGTATHDSDIDNEAEDMTDLEDLFEEMNDKAGQSNGIYFPFIRRSLLCCTCC